MVRGMKYLEESQNTYSSKFERVRTNIQRINSSSATAKYKQHDQVFNEDIVMLKERINAAFDVLMRLHEETINRDSVLAELLLETQMGKNSRLICKLHTNEKLQMFFETL